jgi:hypothetical protein
MSRNYAAGLIVLDVTASGMFQLPSIYSMPRKQSAYAENFTIRS